MARWMGCVVASRWLFATAKCQLRPYSLLLAFVFSLCVLIYSWLLTCHFALRHLNFDVETQVNQVLSNIYDPRFNKVKSLKL